MLTAQFRQRVEEAGATVESVPDESAAATAVRSLAERLGATRVTATRDAARYTPAGSLVSGTTSQVADADLGVSVAELAVAETGSVLLGSNAPEDRLVGMLARTHAVVVPAGVLVPSLDDAAQALRAITAPGDQQVRYASFVTGPSRTADIERVLTIGVQGPRAVHIVVIEPG